VPSITDSFPELRVPGGLDDIIAQACEKRPEDRFQSATEMLEALDSLASGTRPRAVRKRTTQVRQPVVDPDDEDEDDDEEEEYEEEGGFLARLPVSARIVAGVVLLVAVAGGVWIFGVGGGGPGSAPRLSMLSPGDRTEEQTKYVGLLDDARRSLLSGDTELALGSVETAQQMEVRDSEALLVRAMIYRQMQDHDMALADYRDALSLDPGYAAAAAGLGWVELERGRLDEALASFEQAGKLDSRSGEALAGQGAVAFLRGDRERAGELLSEAVELAGDFAPAHEWMGRVHLAVGDHAGAVAAFVQAKRCDPRSWRAYTGLGEAYLGQGRTDEAEKQLRGALNLAPGAEEPLTTLAAMLIESERYAETINLLTSSAHAGSHALDVLEGAALQGAGRRQDAIAVLERATSGAEVDAQAETLLGILYQQDGDHASAIDRYRRAAAADETLSLPHLNMGLALFALERYEESADELTTAVQLDANSTFAHYGLGILQMDYLGDTERAIFHLEAYIELGGPDDRVGDWVARLRSL
jgi:tetratricopeptide (TPR) repeat protein